MYVHSGTTSLMTTSTAYIAAHADLKFVLHGEGVGRIGIPKEVHAGVFNNDSRKYLMYTIELPEKMARQIKDGMACMPCKGRVSSAMSNANQLIQNMVCGTNDSIYIFIQDDMWYGMSGFEMCGVDVLYSMGVSGTGFYIAFPKDSRKRKTPESQ